jgi:hypothetical protein
MGRGFWILDNITALRQNEINKLKNDPHLFKPDNTVRYRYPMIRSSGTFPKYPRTRVLIDYYLPEGSKESLKLEILDQKGRAVATILSDSTLLESSEEEVENMNLSRSYRYVNEKLENKPGLNRFAWDLRQKGPWHQNPKRRFRGGPLVPPGTYTVTLTFGENTMKESFELLIDPRVSEEGISQADIERQLDMQIQVIDLLNKAGKLQEDLVKEAESLEGKADQSARLNEVNSLLKQLKNEEGAYPQEMLLSQISYLYRMISGADQLPGNDARERYKELLAEFESLKKRKTP